MKTTIVSGLESLPTITYQPWNGDKIDDQIEIPELARKNLQEFNNVRDLNAVIKKVKELAPKIDPEGNTFLHRTIIKDELGLFKLGLLFAPHLIHTNLPLHLAVTLGREEHIQWLLDPSSLGIKDKVSVNSQDEEGKTPLHLAVIHGHRTIAYHLLGRGADPKIFDNDKKTPEEYADDLFQKIILENPFEN